MSERYEFEGKTVDEAVAKGLIELGLDREEVEINVIRKGSRGIFGIGSETALVHMARLPAVQPTGSPVETTEGNDIETVSEIDADFRSDSRDGSESEAPFVARDEESMLATAVAEVTESYDDSDSSSDHKDIAQVDETDIDQEVTAMAVEFLENLLDLMDFEGEVKAEWQDPEPDETDSCLILSIEGESLGSLIGRRGETMNSLQYLLRLMINQKVRTWRNIVVDVAGYKEKRSQQLTQLAHRMADQVIETGRAVSLEPMPSNERRIVHLALRDYPDVYTESSGEVDRRKVHIMPKSLLD